MFGNNKFGQLGDGTSEDKLSPIKITISNEKAHRIACGNDYTLVLTAKGHIYGFGLNSSGQLGIGNQDNTNVPVRSLLPESVFMSKIIAGYHSAAISSQGELYVWGESSLGNFLIPREISWDNEMSITGLEMGEDFTVVIDQKGFVWGFGNNAKGELGQGDLEERESLVQIPDLFSKKIRTFSCGKEFVIALSDYSAEVTVIPRNSLKEVKYVKEARELHAPKTPQSDLQYGEADDSVIRQESELDTMSDRYSHPHQNHHGQNPQRESRLHVDHLNQHRPSAGNKTQASRNSKTTTWKEFDPYLIILLFQ